MQSPARGIILIVDDMPIVRQLAVLMFQEIGFETVDTYSPKTALEIVNSRLDISHLFSDVMLPGGISGHDLAAQVQRRRPDIHIILTSGDTRQARPSFPFVRKPWRVEDIERALRQHRPAGGARPPRAADFGAPGA